MLVTFKNKGLLDLEFITNFGVSVKSEDAIGFFGTGLKYAIAVLLREGQEITIQSGEDTYYFSVDRKELKGKTFEFVTISENGEAPRQLGFTTELGKNWELWKAYRELACNCYDEGGAIVTGQPICGEDSTTIYVSGKEFYEVYLNRSKYILEGTPIYTCAGLEVYSGESSNMFYKKVRVKDLGARSLFTYNLTNYIKLTEDRTIESEWEMNRQVIRAVRESTDEKFIMSFITADEGTYEYNLRLSSASNTPSAHFIDTVGKALENKYTGVNRSAIKVWEDFTGNISKPSEVTPSPIQEKTINKAVEFCERIGFRLKDCSYEIKVSDSLGEGVLGMALNNTIYVAERAFQIGGTKQVASVLIEEYIHLKDGYEDCTYNMQNYLFEKIVSMGEDMLGEPL